MTTNIGKPDITLRVKEIVSAQLNVPKDEIENDTSFTADLGADSLEVTEIMMLIEDEFWITFPEKPVTDLSTVGQTVDFVLAARGRGADATPLM